MKFLIKENQITRLIEKNLNMEIPKVFPWWIKLEITEFTRMKSLPKYANIKGVLEIDSDWGEEQWINWHYEKTPNFNNPEYPTLLSEIIGVKQGDEIKQEINNILPYVVGDNVGIVSLSDIQVKIPENKNIVESLMLNESKFKETIINNIDNEGLLNTLRVTNMSFTKLSSMIGMDFLTNKIMIQFIKDVSKENAGISVYDIDVDPIPYKKGRDEYSEIIFFGSTKATIYVYSENGLLGDFHVMYESMNDDILMEVFDLIMGAYEDGKLNVKQ